MAIASVLAPRDVPTTLNFYKPLDEEPPHRYAYAVEGKPQTNVGSEPHPAVVHDVRGREAEFSLDKNGFQWVHWPSVAKDFVDDEVIKEKYYPEVERLLKEVAGAKRVFIFDHTIRRSPNSEDQRDPKRRGPAELVHIDQTYEASIERVKYHLPDEADRLLKSRVRIINVWRPIANPVAHKPLAVADWRTLDHANLVKTALHYPHRTGSTYSVRYDPGLEFYYLGGQTPDEVTLIKCFDSETDRARLTPHTAFADAGSPKDAPHRQSIEVRVLVFDTE
ncbi:hypothetical protein DICSQDRAFT_65724 [Dichomitus squalens LYAD-421 SS1]|uniref:Methyltransferase n=1 Tax=Dichomitus squalens (strain LYAD-421) TaxID=732165 RepID=R7STF5_DICSQ|nr:uncharacterized protein DICSQDRAFT_65724 [Dichomitus squalens LYAD-421 SS1]EJF59035.1 hypothetical protein DICSQDRAFT_65724 [Dichomitus squalens LYAD-421 SS1]